MTSQWKRNTTLDLIGSAVYKLSWPGFTVLLWQITVKIISYKPFAKSVFWSSRVKSIGYSSSYLSDLWWELQSFARDRWNRSTHILIPFSTWILRDQWGTIQSFSFNHLSNMTSPFDLCMPAAQSKCKIMKWHRHISVMQHPFLNLYLAPSYANPTHLLIHP